MMTEQVEKLTPEDGKSLDIEAQNIEQLKQLFPDVFREDKVDFEALKAVLGEHVEDVDERYNFTWHGKNKARQIAQTPSTGTLRPCKEESVNWDTAQNLFIEGDNLEVLKLLQKSYNKKVKMIYIDPPYNTGKDFVYKDDFRDNLANYKDITGQLDSKGKTTSNNPDTSGRYHTDWLNMIYPRLKLAHNLLSSDGVIFMSIDDNEFANLKKIADEIFGEINFIGQFIWNTEGNTDNQYKVKVNHEYILAYYKDSSMSDKAVGYVIDPSTPEDSNLRKGFADNNINKNNPANPPSTITLPIGFPSSEESLFYKGKDLPQEFFSTANEDKFISDELKSLHNIEPKSGLPIKLDDMIVENFKLTKQCRIYVGVANKNKLLEFINNGCKEILDDDGFPIRFYINANAGVRYRKTRDKARNILSVLRGFGTTEKNKTELKKDGIYFDYPKPLDLIKYLVQIGCESKDGLILDFFAGSATLAHAVLVLNAQEKTNRKFLCVQLPEEVGIKSQAYKAGYKYITEISRERIKKAGDKALDINKNTEVGFKSFKLDSTNINPWEATFETVEDMVEQSVESIKTNREDEDVLYEILLKYGLDLSYPISEHDIAGKRVFDVAFGSLIVCLDNEITNETIVGIGELKKELDSETTRVVIKDAGYEDSCDKLNAIETLKQFGITDVKCI